jgi:peptide/nickel transport system ATP-binding protein
MAGTGTAHLRDSSDVILRIEDLVVEFPTKAGTVHAVSGISLDVCEGETLGLVGESGCGKSTTGRAIMQLPAPTSGRVLFEGTDLAAAGRQELREVRTRLQLIFQDPISSLNPRRKVKDIVAEPLRIWKRGTEAERQARVAEVLDAVGLDPAVASEKRPHQFSGGQCQRISIARSLVLDPRLVICDEPVSALDVSIRAQILNLLAELQEGLGLTYLFITHDLAVVNHFSDDIAVMYLGKMVEQASADELFENPVHPYTEALLSAIPQPSLEARTERILLKGELSSPIDPKPGCRFAGRCVYAKDVCTETEPPLADIGEGHLVACHFSASRNKARR